MKHPAYKVNRNCVDQMTITEKAMQEPDNNSFKCRELRDEFIDSANSNIA